jgi:ATP synthase F1 gamma subunit
MINGQNQIGKDIEAMISIKEFIVSNEEIAANNMRQIRHGVLDSRDFMSEITSFYNEVKRSYKTQFNLIMAKAKKNNKLENSNFSSLVKKNKTLCLLLSSNGNLYGDVVRNNYELFKKVSKDEKADIAVVGKVGKRFFDKDNPNYSYAYFDFPDKGIDIALLKPIVKYIIQYEKVIVFHSKFETLLRQKPIAFVISETQQDNLDNKEEIRFLFEPSLEKVVEYFEKEIFSSIFEQTIQESHLAKFASRMVTLDSASDNIKKKLAELYVKERILKHQKINKDQLNSLSRIMKRDRV